GFSEVGNLEEERKIHSFASEHGMRILGPNIFGHYSAKVSLNATLVRLLFLKEMLQLLHKVALWELP
ncbi:hypothetical protein KKF86_04495, partial [bacterium]|nr:hypothetical protein [bacterium]